MLCFNLGPLVGGLVSGHQDISSLTFCSFDILFSDRQGVKKGCDCDMCKQRSPSSGNNGEQYWRINVKKQANLINGVLKLGDQAGEGQAGSHKIVDFTVTLHHYNLTICLSLNINSRHFARLQKQILFTNISHELSIQVVVRLILSTSQGVVLNFIFLHKHHHHHHHHCGQSHC